MRKVFLFIAAIVLGFVSCQDVQIYEGIDGLDGIDGQDGLSVYHHSSLVDPTQDYVNGGILNVFYHDIDGNEILSSSDAILNSYIVWHGNDGMPGQDATVDVSVVESNGCNTVTIITGNTPPIVFDVCDGIDGKDGIDGQDGADGVDGVDGQDGVDGVCDCVNCDECYDCTGAGFFANTTNFNNGYQRNDAIADGWTIFGFGNKSNEPFNGLWGATDAVFGGDPNGQRNSMIQTPELQACELEQVRVWAKTVDPNHATNDSPKDWKYRMVITYCDGSEEIVEKPTGHSNNWTNGTGPKPLEPEFTKLTWKGSWFNVSKVRIEVERKSSQGTHRAGIAKVQLRYHSTVNPNN